MKIRMAPAHIWEPRFGCLSLTLWPQDFWLERKSCICLFPSTTISISELEYWPCPSHELSTRGPQQWVADVLPTLTEHRVHQRNGHKTEISRAMEIQKEDSTVICMIRALCVSFPSMPAHFALLLDCELLEGLMALSAAPQAIATWE